ncbi:MAG: hypothetical protein LBO20_07025, partial [Bifidobacteriaceae bacterium]|nr:hypothetical protein [Bifidobacteriaceae bacterium]
MTAATLAQAGLEPRDDLATLYAWHDGCWWEDGLTLGQMWVFTNFIFTPLAEMIETYGQLCRSGYWNREWFPVFMDDA